MNQDCNLLDLIGPMLKYLIPIGLAFVAGLVALLQVKTNILTASKVKWIEQFRNVLSEFLKEIGTGVLAYSHHITDMEMVSKRPREVKNDNLINSDTSISKATELYYQLSLLLDSKQPSHSKLEGELFILQEELQKLMRNLDIKQIEVLTFLDYLSNKVSPIIIGISKEIIEHESQETKKLFVLR
jgi:hypothetical protein